MTQEKIDRLLDKLALTKVWFRDSVTGEMIFVEPLTVMKAEAELNYKLFDEGAASLEYWCELLGITSVMIQEGEEWDIESIYESGETRIKYMHLYRKDGKGVPFFDIILSAYPCEIGCEDWVESQLAFFAQKT